MENTWILPEVRAEIDAMLKDRRQRAQAKRESELYDGELFPRYALIDAALWGDDIDALLPLAVRRSLFGGATGNQLRTVAPHLVDVGADDELAEQLKSGRDIERRVTWLHSELSINDLRNHLRRFLRMKTEAGAYLYFRFYDPYVVNVVFPNLTQEQLSEFFDKIEYMVTEDVRISERRIFHLSEDKELRIKCKATDHVDDK